MQEEGIQKQPVKRPIVYGKKRYLKTTLPLGDKTNQYKTTVKQTPDALLKDNSKVIIKPTNRKNLIKQPKTARQRPPPTTALCTIPLEDFSIDMDLATSTDNSTLENNSNTANTSIATEDTTINSISFEEISSKVDLLLPDSPIAKLFSRINWNTPLRFPAQDDACLNEASSQDKMIDLSPILIEHQIVDCALPSNNDDCADDGDDDMIGQDGGSIAKGLSIYDLEAEEMYKTIKMLRIVKDVDDEIGS